MATVKKDSPYVEVQVLTDDLKPHKKNDKVEMHRTTADALVKHEKVKIVK